MALPENPVTREEMYLSRISGQDTPLPSPVTREEMYLAAIAEGGGGGSGLPEVSESDNGKFLRVVDGAWAAASVDEWQGGSY